MELPKKKYNVIYADPPWNIGSVILKKWKSPLNDKYPVMSDEQITHLPIKELASENCGLFLWVTHTKLPFALKLIEMWGFKYYCVITWNKLNGWSQHGFHKKTELLLFGYKGKITEIIKQEGKFIPTLIEKRSTKHSEKPHLVYSIIERSTTGIKIELFARHRREGWDVWGNEVPTECQKTLSKE